MKSGRQRRLAVHRDGMARLGVARAPTRRRQDASSARRRARHGHTRAQHARIRSLAAAMLDNPAPIRIVCANSSTGARTRDARTMRIATEAGIGGANWASSRGVEARRGVTVSPHLTPRQRATGRTFAVAAAARGRTSHCLQEDVDLMRAGIVFAPARPARRMATCITASPRALSLSVPRWRWRSSRRRRAAGPGAEGDRRVRCSRRRRQPTPPAKQPQQPAQQQPRPGRPAGGRAGASSRRSSIRRGPSSAARTTTRRPRKSASP